MPNGLSFVDHSAVFKLENRSFDHMQGFLYSGNGNVSPSTSNPSSSSVVESLFVSSRAQCQRTMNSGARLRCEPLRK
jgi:phospholipase C